LYHLAGVAKRPAGKVEAPQAGLIETLSEKGPTMTINTLTATRRAILAALRSLKKMGA